MVGKKDGGRAEGPLARLKMLEGRSHIAFLTDPVADLRIHEPNPSGCFVNFEPHFAM
jgi:hypothetical protein